VALADCLCERTGGGLIAEQGASDEIGASDASAIGYTRFGLRADCSELLSRALERVEPITAEPCPVSPAISSRLASVRERSHSTSMPSVANSLAVSTYSWPTNSLSLSSAGRIFCGRTPASRR
jgi:hypothetical protein